MSDGLVNAGVSGQYVLVPYNIEQMTIEEAYQQFITEYPSGQRVILAGDLTDDILELNALTEGTDIFIYSVTATSPELAQLRNGVSFAYNDVNLTEE